MRLTPFTIFWGTILAAAVLVAGSGVLFVRLSTTVSDMRSQLEMLRSNIAAREEERTAARFSETLLEQKSADMERISSFFISRERPVAFIEDLEKLVRDTENEIAISVDEKRSRPGWLAFQLIVEGSRKNLFLYLDLLERMPYKIMIEEVNFREGGAGTSALVAQLSLAIQVKTE